MKNRVSMKRPISFTFLGAALFFAALFSLPSCSQADRNLYKYSSAESLVVASVDPATAVENLGFQIDKSGIVLSPKGQRLLHTAFDNQQAAQAEELLRLPGLALDELLVVRNSRGDLLAAMRLTDRPAFEKWLNSTYQMLEGVLIKRIEGETDVYVLSPRLHLRVTQAVALLVWSPTPSPTGADALQRFVADAEKAPLQPWQMDALCRGNLVNAVVNLQQLDASCQDRLGRPLFDSASSTLGYNAEDLANGYCVATSSLQGNSLNFYANLRDSLGKVLECTDSEARQVNFDSLFAAVPYASAVQVLRLLAQDGVPGFHLREAFDGKDLSVEITSDSGPLLQSILSLF